MPNYRSITTHERTSLNSRSQDIFNGAPSIVSNSGISINDSPLRSSQQSSPGLIPKSLVASTEELTPPIVKVPRDWYHYGSLLLENRGSVARDHLASERTYLAWLRTSLSLASVGVGITQLLKLGEGENTDHISLKFSKGLGICFVLVAILTLSIGTVRYFSVQELLIRERFPVSQLGVSSIYVLITILTIVTIIVVLII